ncbi:hypothetical protein HF394_05225 [Planococcus glaciei]|uniref:Uncharacterized protein n=1 Tax=Planococcus glaciei TaxID=459472 RepID=A0A7H8Q7U3_9BACL|nr:hypothetical protein [Planococcus glaciei]QDY45148.1 hypothetical protein FK545_05565 [Planococcus glaciei]QKX50034.1 hypothetical protein HF394_05225 [Planococcus glaciei]
MIVDVILGNNIDTVMWIRDLQENEVECIIVVDYEYDNDPLNIEGVVYMSPIQAQKYIRKFDKINYYKSLYAYPGMQGNMSCLHKKDKN